MFEHGGMTASVADLRALLERAQRDGVGLARARLPGVAAASAEPVTDGALPVLAPLRPLFPAGGLRRGSTVEIAARTSAVGVDPPGSRRAGADAWDGAEHEEPAVAGGCALVLALLAGASAAGSWCVLVGAPGLGLAAAAEAGIELSRFALVPAPGSSWSRAVGALVDGFDLVVVRPPVGLAPAEARALSTRARHHGAVLVSLGPWSGAQIRLAPVRASWEGLGAGHGRLRARRVLVRATGRGAAGGRPRSAELWLPAPDGMLAAAEPSCVEPPVEAVG